MNVETVFSDDIFFNHFVSSSWFWLVCVCPFSYIIKGKLIVNLTQWYHPIPIAKDYRYFNIATGVLWDFGNTVETVVLMTKWGQGKK
jgi:hypothetical protein